MGATYTCGYYALDDGSNGEQTVAKLCQYFSGKCRQSKYENSFSNNLGSAQIFLAPHNSAEDGRAHCQELQQEAAALNVTLKSYGHPPQQHGGDRKSLFSNNNSSLKVKDLKNLDKEDLQELTLYQYAQVHRVKQMLAAEEQKEKKPYDFPFPQKHQWQLDLEAKIAKPPDNRKIIFVVDKKGGGGKTQWTKWITQQVPNSIAIRLDSKDFLFQIAYQTLIIIDVPRANVHRIPYGRLEELKDGIWTTSKFHGTKIMRLAQAHVIVMMNDFPNMKALSEDKYDIIEIP